MTEYRFRFISDLKLKILLTQISFAYGMYKSYFVHSNQSEVVTVAREEVNNM